MHEADERRFPDGAAWRVEIPSVEGPVVFEAVLEEAAARAVPVHRISQGSGIGLQTDEEIERMVALGDEHEIEVCLFVGPRASWDVGAQVRSSSGVTGAAALRGAGQLALAIEDVRRGCALGLRSVLVGDIGLLGALAELKQRGDLPAELVLKTSVALPASNPATVRLLADLGANTINLPSDLAVSQLAEIREAVAVPLDFYLESPDDFGGVIRHWEVAEIVRALAPVYLKFGLRNAPALYPSGGHLEPTAVAMGRERVRRAQLALTHLARSGQQSEVGVGGAS